MTFTESAPRAGLVAGIRVVAALAVIASSVAITALTVGGNDKVTVVVPQAQSGPAPASAGAAPAAVPPAPAAGAPAAGAVQVKPGAAAPAATAAKPGTASPGSAGSSPPGASARPNGPGTSQPIAPGGQGSANPFASQPVTPQPPCPLGWPAPAAQGGLASLIGLAPLAGPFSSEAFALGPVYQPLLQLVGPVLAEISPVLAHYQPAIDPIIKQVQGVEAVVLEAILPYYGPYREQLINAEGELAKALTPILDGVYRSPAASCFVAWQGQIIAQAKGGTFKVASLAHPGAMVELGPKP